MDKIKVFIFIFILCYLPLQSKAQTTSSKSTYTVKGKVISDTDRASVSFALVWVETNEIYATCDIDGDFLLHKVPAGEHTIQVQCLGYAPKKININVEKDLELTIKLTPASFGLSEVNVMAKRTKGDKIVVDQDAIEYVQPISISDVLLLLPGSVYLENTMSSFSKITSRQAGSDENTSLGMGIMADGVPMSNDAMRIQMVGVTENSISARNDTEIQSRTGMNQGVDMRYISTDHIQSVEFTRGIASAQYGNLSSGLIQINSKFGVTPLRVRAKADLKNKLFYVGKGIKLSEKAGTLHLGADYLYSIDDIREEMDKFSRITGQAYYNNQVYIGEKTLDIDAKLSQTITVNKMKKDELTYEYDETYKSDYSKTNMLVKGNLTLNQSWIEKLELITSVDVTFDKISRHKMVLSSSGPLNVPLAKEEGEHEGVFLPGRYYSDFYIDNIPINIYSQLNAVSRFRLSNNFSNNTFYGLEYRYSKNKGDGAVIEDETRPPFPYDNSYMRPRPNHEIPAISVGAAYLQTDFSYNKEKNYLKLSLGGRLTKMFNLPADYTLSDILLAEPRVNLSYTRSSDLNGSKLKNTIRIGYGEENKLPTMDYLYPEKLYKDFYMLNAYRDQEEYRRLITYTHIFNVENKEIRENRNRKIEAGWDIEYKDFSMFITAFYEKSTTGFEYFTVYNPLTYDLYETLKPGVDISNRKPEKEDYVKEPYSIFTTSSQVKNSKKTTKQGIEYRIILPKINPLATRIEINGAYYKTNYGSALQEFYYPDVKIAGKVYPYVGIYNNNPEYEYKRFNTNVWFNTHIPKFKLIFTNFFQFIWIASNQYKDLRQEYPAEYIGFDGVRQAVTAEDIQKINSDDMTYRHLKKTVKPLNYEKNSEPVSIMWNIKATKEFNKYARLSFFVNNIVDINPKYTSGKKKTSRNWETPFFGIELTLNFN